MPILSPMRSKSAKESQKNESQYCNADTKMQSSHSQHTQSTRTTLNTCEDDSSSSQELRKEINECQERISQLQSMVQKLEVGLGDESQPLKKAKKRKGKAKKKTSYEDDESSEWIHIDEKQPLQHDSSHHSGHSSRRQSRRNSLMNNSSHHSKHSGRTHSGGRNSIRPSRRSSLVPTGSNHSKNSIRPSRRSSVATGSNHSKNPARRPRHSMRRDSICSARSFKAGGVDDGASAVSQNDLQSVSYSIKSLPREIELMDEDDYSFFGDSYRNPNEDSRSFESRSASGYSHDSRRSRRRNSTKNIDDEFSFNSSGRNQDLQSPDKSTRSRDRISSKKLKEINKSTDAIAVENREILDPYGEKGVYSGAMSKSTGMPNGRGLLEYEKTGRWCEGDWIHGRLTGNGRLSNGGGDFYEGGLKHDHFHGTGVMRFADGRVFEGEFIKGQMILGKMTYQDGSIYNGSWVDSTRHGKGTCIFVDGSVYEGEFKEGHFHGQGQMTWNDGGFYIGKWCEGEMHGCGKEVRADGTLRHEGEWLHGQPIRSNN